eukprot:5423758-Amphidinium_carterae.1
MAAFEQFSNVRLANRVHSCPAGIIKVSQAIILVGEGWGRDCKVGANRCTSCSAGIHSVHNEAGPVCVSAALTWLFCDAQILGTKVAILYATSLSHDGSPMCLSKSSSLIGSSWSDALSMTVFFNKEM